MKYLIAVALTLTVSLIARDRDTIPLKSRSASEKTTTGGMLAPVQNPKADAKSDSQPAASQDTEGNEPKPYVAGLDVYGSTKLNEVVLKETLGKDLDLWLQKGLRGEDGVIELENKLAEKVKSKFGFASADWSIIQYFEPGDLAIFITLDVVEKNDLSRRQPFYTANLTSEFKDPDGLIKSWMEYEDLALDMVESGELEPEADECVAFHCPFGHKNAKLKKYEKIFVDGVKKNLDKIVEIQSKDKRPEFRAAASYLLAYHKDGNKVVAQMVDRIKDSDVMVRNNALRVLGDMAEFHQQYVIPIKPVLEALEFPRVSDRSKAVYVAYLLALNSQSARETIAKSSVPTLIQMMGSKQPDHRELSHGILRKVSGKEFAVTDLQSWKNWYTKNGKELSLTRK